MYYALAQCTKIKDVLGAVFILLCLSLLLLLLLGTR